MKKTDSLKLILGKRIFYLSLSHHYGENKGSVAGGTSKLFPLSHGTDYFDANVTPLVAIKNVVCLAFHACGKI